MDYDISRDQESLRGHTVQPEPCSLHSYHLACRAPFYPLQTRLRNRTCLWRLGRGYVSNTIKHVGNCPGKSKHSCGPYSTLAMQLGSLLSRSLALASGPCLPLHTPALITLSSLLAHSCHLHGVSFPLCRLAPSYALSLALMWPPLVYQSTLLFPLQWLIWCHPDETKFPRTQEYFSLSPLCTQGLGVKHSMIILFFEWREQSQSFEVQMEECCGCKH